MTSGSGTYGRDHFTQEQWDRIIDDPHAAQQLFNDRNFDKDSLNAADSAALIQAAVKGARLKEELAIRRAADEARAKALAEFEEPPRPPVRVASRVEMVKRVFMTAGRDALAKAAGLSESELERIVANWEAVCALNLDGEAFDALAIPHKNRVSLTVATRIRAGAVLPAWHTEPSISVRRMSGAEGIRKIWLAAAEGRVAAAPETKVHPVGPASGSKPGAAVEGSPATSATRSSCSGAGAADDPTAATPSEPKPGEALGADAEDGSASATVRAAPSKKARVGEPFVPVPGARLTRSHHELIRGLETLTPEIGPRKTRLRDAYLVDPRFRNVYNKINIELNIRGRVAPHWRPHPKVPFSHHTTGQKILNNDKRVLDLHWLFLNARPASLRDYRFQALFEADEFDFKAAWDLVTTIGKTTHILGHLNLPLDTQMGLTTLRSQEARDLLEVIEKDADALGNRLRHSRQPKYEKVADDWRNVRLAYGIAVASISGGSSAAEPTDRHVASVYRLITGRVERAGSEPGAQTISDRAIGDKLRRIKRWMDGGAT